MGWPDPLPAWHFPHPKAYRPKGAFIGWDQHTRKRNISRREKDLDPPIQMCDGLSRNIPKEFKVILSNCIAHARRKFVDINQSFPKECSHVLKVLEKVYI